MLLKLLLVIPSAVEESLTSQGRVALFFTRRLRLEYHDRTWSRRQIVGDPSTSLRPLRMTKERISARSVTRCSADKLAASMRHGRTDHCLCAFRDRSPPRCNVRPRIRWRGSHRYGVRDFFETPASDNPTN